MQRLEEKVSVAFVDVTELQCLVHITCYPNWSPAAIKSAMMTTQQICDDETTQRIRQGKGAKDANKPAGMLVTNVGRPNSIFLVNVKAPEGIKVLVYTRRLVFNCLDHTLIFRLN